jgi:hypothetical protein
MISVQLQTALHESAAKLPKKLTIGQAREKRLDLLASLSDGEFRILDHLISVEEYRARHHGVFSHDVVGSPAGDVTIGKEHPAPKGKRKRIEVQQSMSGGGAVAKQLVRQGWLRYVKKLPGDKFGHFWPTEAAEMVWRALREKATAGELKKRRQKAGH